MLAVDHLVVAARTLEEGDHWCRATFGVGSQPGGRHASMGTHNRLLRIASGRFPRSYLEIIALDGAAPPPARRRWFDLDDPALQASLAAGPRLVHWVARAEGPGELDRALADLSAAGFDAGAPIAAERATPRGPLRWRIALRDDGARLAGGALPLVIEWGEAHPVDDLPESGVRLERVAVAGLPRDVRERLHVDDAEPDGIEHGGGDGVGVERGDAGRRDGEVPRRDIAAAGPANGAPAAAGRAAGAAALTARFASPAGRVDLRS